MVSFFAALAVKPTDAPTQTLVAIVSLGRVHWPSRDAKGWLLMFSAWQHVVGGNVFEAASGLCGRHVTLRVGLQVFSKDRRGGFALGTRLFVSSGLSLPVAEGRLWVSRLWVSWLCHIPPGVGPSCDCFTVGRALRDESDDRLETVGSRN